MYDLALGLRTLDVPVRFACPVPSSLAVRASEAQIDVVAVAKGGLIDGNAVQTLRRMLRNREVDVVHAHNGRTALSAALATRLAGRGACVVTQHFLEPDRVGRRGPKAILSRIAHRWVSRHTHGFIAVSDAARNRMLARGDAPAYQITIVPNGLAATDPATLPDRCHVRSNLGIAPDTPLIVCIARLEREKDIPTLAAAMEKVFVEFPDAVCLIAGDGSLRGSLELLPAIQSGIVRLLGYRDDALSLLDAADLVVMSSLLESFGLVLVEAMSLSKPVIATRAGGPCEIVVEGKTGLLVPPADPAAMAAAIGTLLSDPERCRRMGERGRERFMERFTAERMAQQTLAVYRKALNR